MMNESREPWDVRKMFCLIGVLLALALPSAPAEAAPRGDHPSVLFVYTDDQAPWGFGASGYAQAHTPHIDQLASEGVYLKNSFVTTPVCSPARASLMTSRYASEYGILDFIPHPGHRLYDSTKTMGLDPASVTFAEVIRASGYVTGLVGKWHLGDWTVSESDTYHPTNHGFGYFMGLTGGGTTPADPTLEEDGVVRTLPGLTTDILTDRAIDFLRRHRGQPFLLCLNYRAPHSRWLPVADEDWAPYEDLDPIIPNPDYPGLDVERVKRMTREYLASITGVDRNLGRVLRVLDELSLTRSTVVVFTSDHGYNMGHNGIYHKGNGIWATTSLPEATRNIAAKYRPNMYDHSIRVPAIVRWPGVVRAGSVIEQTTTSLDWYPTLVEITGADLPAEHAVRGRSMVPLLEGEAPADWNQDYYGEYSMINYCRAFMRCYRTPEWKLVRDFLNPDRDELYDLQNDPAEAHNLIGESDARIERIIRRLDAKIREHMDQNNDRLLRDSATPRQFGSDQ